MLRRAETVKAERLWQSEIAQAETAVAKAEIALASAHRQLADATLRSPIDGVVLALSADPGHHVAAHTEILTVIGIDQVEIHARLPERQLPIVDRATDVRAMVEDSDSGELLLDQMFKIRGIQVSPITDGITQSTEVQIVVDNPQYRLKPGMLPSLQLVERVDGAD